MQDDKLTRTPIIDPLLLALKSRRVLVAILTLIGGVLTLAVPELAAVRDELLTLLLALGLAVIGGYSLEDAARAARDTAAQTPPTTSEDDLRRLMREVIDGTLDELNLR